ncbi:MAG: DUF92 domain-containing protein [Bacteroides sp.]|jgi:uncharacterized protein (TIGR00297 family)|nr:DUF92 domain-containing protein [Bacteroides sp.]
MTNQRGLIIRKIIHLSLGLIILILSCVLERNVLLYLIIAGTIFSFLTFNYKEFHLLHKTTDASLGTLYYPLGILTAYLILYDLPLYYFHSSLMVLSISDTLANFAGLVKKGNGWIRTFHDRKSVYGIIAYSLSAFLIFWLLLPDFLHLNFPYILFALLWAVILETASMRGSDNFSIPAGLALFFLLTFQYEVNSLYLSAILVALTPGCYLLFKLHILTRRGSFVAYLLGFYLAGIAGWQWLMPVLLFFLSSAAFSRIKHAKQGLENKSTARNAWQVVANIIWAVISSALFLITQEEIFILFFIAFVAAVTADTWASEVGPLLNKMCFLLSTMRTAPAGTNGGISFFGSMAALSGATMISALSYFLFFGSWQWDIIAILSASAFLACFADSLLGTFAEDKLLRLDYFKKRKTLESITPNDLVNLAGSFTAFAFYLFLSWIF